jgi:NAD dependent epimerase/dehydratase family enzyme
VPVFILKALLGEFSEVFTRGQKAVPKKLLDNGFVFGFPDIHTAFKSLV